jgi:elongation factor 2
LSTRSIASAEEVYDCMHQVIDDINTFIATHQLKEFSDQRVSLEDGTVCFGSGYFGWSCSIDTFLGVDRSPEEQETMRQALAKRENFVKHIIRPILRMHRMCGVLPMKKQVENVARVKLPSDFLSEVVKGWRKIGFLSDKDDVIAIQTRKLLKKAMLTWLPAADALVDMIAVHIPSPVIAQHTRAPLLYSGNLLDVSGQGIRSCDPNGPVIVYVSKVVPSDNKTVAFGRVFSGTIRPGVVLRALRTDGSEGTARISSIMICGLKEMLSVPSARLANWWLWAALRKP